MDKNEPSLAPEWLRGPSASGHHIHHGSHQDDLSNAKTPRQRLQPHGGGPSVSYVEEYSPRYTPPGSGRRGDRDRPSYERPYSSNSQVYSNFNRGQRFEDQQGSRDRGPGLGDRDRDKDRHSVDDRDRERDGLFRRPLNLQPRHDSDPRRLGQISGRLAEDVSTRRDYGLQGQEHGKALPTAMPTSSGSLSSSMQKAAFERNFPTLGQQERSERASWGQQASPRLSVDVGQGTRSVGGGLLSPAGSSGEGWSSRLAEPPMISGAGTPGSGSLLSPRGGYACLNSGGAAGATSAAATAPRMAEALQQKASQGRLSPQSSVDSQQRLEELALRQSRQLVPMKPSLPFAQKVKPKTARVAEATAPSKAPTALTSLGGTFRTSVTSPGSRAEPPKTVLVRQRSKELVLGVVNGPLPSPGAGVATPGPSLAAGGAPKRPTKQLLDRHALPIGPANGSGGARHKDGGGVGTAPPAVLPAEEKRDKAAQQNRSDFFNALRRKAGGAASPPVVAPAGSPEAKAVGGEEEAGESIRGPRLANGVAVAPENGAGVEGVEPSSNGMVSCKGPAALANGVMALRIPEDEAVAHGRPVGGGAEAPSARVGGSEEEEAAFLRSLGWTEEGEDEDGGEEGLTEEEINAFYSKASSHNLQSRPRPSLPMSSVVFTPRLSGSRSQPNLVVGSVGSVSSGFTSSDSESD